MKEYNEELNQLEKEAPLLFSLRSKRAFQTPDSYFDLLEETLNAQALPKTGSFLAPENYFSALEAGVLNQTSGTPSTEKMEVPDGYFDKLESSILAAIEEEDESEVASGQNERTTKVFSIRRYAVSAAAVAAVLAGLFFGTDLFTPKEECITFACLLEQTDLTEEELIFLYDEDIAEELLEGENVSILNGLDDSEEAIEYLLDSQIDIDEYFYDDEI